MSALKALARTVAALLREDPRRCLLGEDVRSGGMLGLSREAVESEELLARVLGSPLTASAHVAHAGGLGLAGQRPIVLLPSASALLEALPAVRELGRLGWRSGGALAASVLFVAPNGPGFGLGGEAAESAEAALAAVPGIELWSSGRAEQLCSALRCAAEFDDESPASARGPRVLLIPRSVVVHELLGEAEAGPRGARAATEVVREGDRATVFAWGEALGPALAAAQACAEQEGIEAQVVELARLAPLAEAELVELANASGKIVIAHAGPRRAGPGAELAALFADRSILHLDAPILRVTGAFDGSGTDAGLVSAREEHRASPSASAIAEAITHVVHY